MLYSMLIVLIVLILLVITTLVFASLFLIKNEVTRKCRIIIVEAIGAYLRDHINEVTLVDFDDMESYDDTFNRIWDWGHTRILPKDKYELIKPYIKVVERKDEK